MIWTHSPLATMDQPRPHPAVSRFSVVILILTASSMLHPAQCAGASDLSPHAQLNPPPAGLNDDMNIFDMPESATRGKRTIDILLQGLADALGYELRPRINGTASPQKPQKPPQKPATNPTVPKTPLAPKPPATTVRTSMPEETTPKGTNATDTDLLAQREEDEDEDSSHEDLKEDEPGGEVDDYIRETAGQYFRKEYDRIRASERNPHLGLNYYEDDDKEKAAPPAKRDEERDDNYYQYYLPSYNVGVEYKYNLGSGSADAPKYTFSATSEGPPFAFAKPFSYTFDIPNQTPQQQEQQELQQQQQQLQQHYEQNPDEPQGEVELQPTIHPLHTEALFIPPAEKKDPKVLNSFKASYAGQLPISSTSKPQMAQILQEMEGTKQDSLWPPPFDYAFDSTDPTIVAVKPAAVVQQNSIVGAKSAQLVSDTTQWPQAGYHPGKEVLSLVSPQQPPPLYGPTETAPTNLQVDENVVTASPLGWIGARSSTTRPNQGLPSTLSRSPATFYPPIYSPSNVAASSSDTNVQISKNAEALRSIGWPTVSNNTAAAIRNEVARTPLARAFSWLKASPASFVNAVANGAHQQKKPQAPVEKTETTSQVGAYAGLVIPFLNSGARGFQIAESTDGLVASPTSPVDVKAAAPEKEYSYPSRGIDVSQSQDFATAKPPERTYSHPPRRIEISRPQDYSTEKPFEREYVHPSQRIDPSRSQDYTTAKPPGKDYSYNYRRTDISPQDYPTAKPPEKEYTYPPQQIDASQSQDYSTAKPSEKEYSYPSRRLEISQAQGFSTAKPPETEYTYPSRRIELSRPEDYSTAKPSETEYTYPSRGIELSRPEDYSKPKPSEKEYAYPSRRIDASQAQEYSTTKPSEHEYTYPSREIEISRPQDYSTTKPPEKEYSYPSQRIEISQSEDFSTAKPPEKEYTYPSRGIEVSRHQDYSTAKPSEKEYTYPSRRIEISQNQDYSTAKPPEKEYTYPSRGIEVSRHQDYSTAKSPEKEYTYPSRGIEVSQAEDFSTAKPPEKEYTYPSQGIEKSGPQDYSTAKPPENEYSYPSRRIEISQAQEYSTAKPSENEYSYTPRRIEVYRHRHYSTAKPPAKPNKPEPEQTYQQPLYVSTTEPSFFREQIVSSPKPFTRQPYSSNNAIFGPDSSEEQPATPKPYPYYNKEEPDATTAKPYIPPANHYGIRLSPPTTTTTTTTPIPPRAQAASQHNQTQSGAPPTSHYGIRLPPPAPPTPQRRPPPRPLTPEEEARRHHVDFLRHSHDQDDYEHRPYEEYPEIAGVRYLFEDDDDKPRADEDAAPAGEGSAAPRWRPGPPAYEPPEGARDFFRPQAHPASQPQQHRNPHSSFSVYSPLTDDYTSLDYYFADPPTPRHRRPRPSARLAMREAEEAAEAVRKRSDAFATAAPPTAPAPLPADVEHSGLSAPSTSKSLTKETISRVSKLEVTGKVHFYPDEDEGWGAQLGLRKR